MNRLVIVLGCALGAALFAPVSAHAQCTFPGAGATLTDGDGFLWDIDNAGRVDNGSIDAYDIGMSVQVDGVYFPSAAVASAGREIVVGPATLSGLSVTRKIYVSDTDGWARWVDLYSNPTGADITVGIIYEINPGSDGSRQLIATSSGDAVFTTADSWLVTDDSSNGGGDPTLNHNLHDGRTPFQPTAVSETVYSCASTNGTRWDYGSFLIPANSTRGLMTLLGQNSNQADAITNATALSAQTAGLDGLSAADRGSIVNRLLPKNVLFVSDSNTDNNIPAALTPDGHTVTSLLNQFSGTTTAALTGSLTAYDAVIWSATGAGYGSINSDAAMFSNLSTYVAGGGRVYVTGYDSIASPSDTVLAQFLGGTGTVRDVPPVPGPIANIATTLTTGLVDIRNLTPTDSYGDRDAFTGLAPGTIELVQTSTVASESQWVLRPLGAGEIVYVSNGACQGCIANDQHPSWTNPASVYNASLRNFVFGGGGGTGGAANTPPVADAGGPYTANQGAAVALDGSASADPDGTVVQWEWDCGNDGTYEIVSAQGTGDTCTYADDGPQTIALRVTDNDGATDVATASATITNTAPVANAGPASGTYLGTKNNPIALDGSASSDADGTIVTWDWDCDNNGSIEVSAASGTGSSCTYSAVGSYTVTLTVTDDDGGTASASSAVLVGNDPPTADAGGPYGGAEGVAISVDGSASADAGGALVSWDWDCDTNGSVDATGVSASCTYPDDGVYTLTLLVTDDDGATDATTTTVTVTNSDPVMSSVVVPSGSEGATLSFSAAASDAAGDTLTYTWAFGDGGSAVGASVTWVYADDGVYSVTVTVTDGDGGSAVGSGTATITNVAPTFTSVTAPTTGDEGDTLAFGAVVTDVAAGDVASLVVTWSWGDGTADDTGTSVTHVWADDGTWTVTVTVDDQDGGVTTQTSSMVVSNVDPTITSAAPTSALQGVLYTYAPTVSDPGDEVFAWSLSASASPNTTVDASTGAVEWTPDGADVAQGSFTLLLTVNDGDGGADTQVWTVIVSAADTDGDGMSDDWENANGLNPNDPTDAGLDPDVDGATNLDEFGLGTDPNSYDGPAAPVLVSPIAAVEVATPSPDLILDNAADPQGDALLYTFEVYGDAGMSTLLTSTSGVAEDASGSTLWKVDIALSENTEVFWRAAASDAFVTGPFSALESFVVNAIEQAPSVPVLVYPIADEVAASVTPTLQWSESQDPDGEAITYEVEVWDSAATLVTSASGVSGNGTTGEWTVDVALVEDAYYAWTVRATDDEQLQSDWAGEETFFVSEANEAPVGTAFVSPLDGVAITDQTPVMVATEAVDPEGGEVVYLFEIDSSAGFDSGDYNSVEVPHNGSGEVVWSLDDAGIELIEDQITYARVRAIDDDGVSSVPDVISFFVRGDNDAPSVPLLLSPEDGAEGVDRPVLEVQDPTDPEGDAVLVEFAVFTDAELTEVIVSSGQIITGAGTTSWEVDVALVGDVYWSARAVDSLQATSDWAVPWAYRVPDVSGDDDDAGDDDDDDGTGCACQGSVAGGGSATWALLLLIPLALRRRR